MSRSTQTRIAATLGAVAVATSAFVAVTARAQSSQPDDDASAASTASPSKTTFLQYGVAFTAEFATPGSFCRDPQLDCVLGSGGGIAGRAGWRSAGPWYFGGAYELSKQDPTKLYQLAILQQLRGEVRYYIDTGRDIEPFASAGVGLAGYGNEWAISTWGPEAFAALGLEVQTSSGPLIGFAVGYRPIWLQQLTVSSGGDQSRGPGFAHMIGIDLTLEARDPL